MESVPGGVCNGDQPVIVTDGRVKGSGRWSLRKTGPDLSGSYSLLYLKFHKKKLSFELFSEEYLPLQCIQRELQSRYNNRVTRNISRWFIFD